MNIPIFNKPKNASRTKRNFINKQKRPAIEKVDFNGRSPVIFRFISNSLYYEKDTCDNKSNRINKQNRITSLLLEQRHGVFGDHELLVGRYDTYRNL